MKTRLATKILVLTSVSLWPLSALAEEPRGAGANEADYAYEFKDDGLLGKSLATNDSGIRVRTGAVRVMLLRPRLHFVAELLKSAENL